MNANKYIGLLLFVTSIPALLIPATPRPLKEDMFGMINSTENPPALTYRNHHFFSLARLQKTTIEEFPINDLLIAATDDPNEFRMVVIHKNDYQVPATPTTAATTISIYSIEYAIINPKQFEQTTDPIKAQRIAANLLARPSAQHKKFELQAEQRRLFEEAEARATELTNARKNQKQNPYRTHQRRR